MTEHFELTAASYQGINIDNSSSASENRSEPKIDCELVVGIMPVRVVEIVPTVVVEIVPVRVVEIVPDLVVEIVPDLASAGADIAIARIPAQTMGCNFFIGLLLVTATGVLGRLENFAW